MPGQARRLNTGWIDLYLLHWRGPVPLAETLEAFRDLRNAGLIRNWGVSNFDVSDLDDLMSLPGSLHVVTDQVLYNLSRRAPEFDLFPACRELAIHLDRDALAALDAEFPPPLHARPLEVL